MNNEPEIITPIRLKNADVKEQSIHKVLQAVVPLDNGHYGYVYRDMGAYRSDRKYMCNVCKKVLYFVKSLLTHHSHPTHKINCKLPMHNSGMFPETTDKMPRRCQSQSDDEDENEPLDEPAEEETSITPGEPVPPGLEDVVDSVCQIQSTFDSFKSGPLIGLEYIVELISIEQADAEPRYICLLCEKKGDPRSVMVHVTSYNHYLKYICCFFRTVGNKLNLIPKTGNNRSAINTAIIKVAEAIEKHYGRLKPISTEMETFSTKKYQILGEIDEKEHFRETPQTTFLDLVTAAKMEEYSKSPVVNFNIKDMEMKNEELTKKCLEVNKSITHIRSLNKKTDKPPDPKPGVKSVEEKKPEAAGKKPTTKLDPLGSQNPPKKLCISLNKPERSIPGLTKPQVQNIDIIIKKEVMDETETTETVNENPNANPPQPNEKSDEKDDDVIIIPDEEKGPIEVDSLSSVSSRSRSWSRPRNRGRSRSPFKRSMSRGRDRRSRSRDQFGRMKRAGSRGSSFDRVRDRTLLSRDRDRRDHDNRSRRDHESRRRDYDERGRRADDTRDRRGSSRGRRGDSRGRRGDSRSRRDDRSRRGDSRGRREDRYLSDRSREDSRARGGDSRGRRGDSRGRRGDSRDRFDDRRYLDDKKRVSDDRSRDWARNPSPNRYRGEDYPGRRDRFYESEDRNQHISEEIKRKNRWNAYKDELEKLEDDLDKTYKYYQGHPEKHPAYNEEWKSFWNRRYKEIQMSGQDPSKYDFKPEWILFWEKKMKEIHDQKVISEKEALKRKHNLDDLQDIRGDRDLQDISPPTPEANKDVTVNDIKKTWKALTGTEIKAPKREGSPWEPKEKREEEVGYTTQQFFAPKKYVAPVPPVIHSLRMLSVLEHQIGYQATRVIELLAQGLAMEKTKNNHSMSMLLNKDIYLFFEAMKEKLRGQLMAGIVQRHLVSTTRNVIKTVEGMLETNPLKPEVFEPVTIPGVGEVDKMAVAKKIAGSLIKMGKTNVSQEELEQLINAVVGMANASSVKADVSSDKFFSQLNIKNSNASSHINDILSTLIQTAQQSVVGDDLMPVDASYQLENNANIEDEEVEPDSMNTNIERGPSPFSLRSGGTNPIKDKYEEKKDDMGYDDDDDDYSFEDIYHAASEKLKNTTEEKKISSLGMDENSQTESSSTSMSNLRNVSDVLNTIDTTKLSNLFSNQLANKEGANQNLSANAIGDISKSINLNDLKSILKQNQPVPEKPLIDVSLVESIKDTLVQSFSTNSMGVSDPYCSNNMNTVEKKPRERASMDPRNRGVWDPSIKSYESEKDERMSGRPSVWEPKPWGDPQSNERHWEGQNREWANRERAAWEEQKARYHHREQSGPWDNNPYPNPWESGWGPRPANHAFVPNNRPPPFPQPGHPQGPGHPPPQHPPYNEHFRHPPPFY